MRKKARTEKYMRNYGKEERKEKRKKENKRKKHEYLK